MPKKKPNAEEKRRAYLKEYWKTYDKRRVTVTLSESEYRAFEAAADKEGIGVATVVKNMAMAFQQTDAMLSSGVETQLKELNFLVRNVANNINQIAHKANMDASVDVNEVLAYIKQLEAIVREHTKNKLQGE